MHQCFICTCHTILFSKLAHMMFVDSNLPIIRKSNQQKYNLEFLSTLLQPNEKHCILLDYQTMKICMYEKDTLNIWQNGHIDQKLNLTSTYFPTFPSGSLNSSVMIQIFEYFSFSYHDNHQISILNDTHRQNIVENERYFYK